MTEEKSLGGKVLAEVLGTFILVLMGDGVVANVGLAPRLASTAYNWNTIAWGWGLAVMVAVYAVGGISGAHINPAVTIGMAVRRALPLREVVPYIIGQMIGAFLGAFGVYLCYRDGLLSAGLPNVWCTGPGSTMSTAYWGGGVKAPIASYALGTAFITEIIGTMVLLWGVCSYFDKRNWSGSTLNIAPLLVGLLVVGIGLTLGGPSGYAINPARDLGPRLFGTLAGTTGLWSAGDGWYWLVAPIIGPIIGGIIGVLSYDAIVGRFFPKEK